MQARRDLPSRMVRFGRSEFGPWPNVGCWDEWSETGAGGGIRRLRTAEQVCFVPFALRIGVDRVSPD
jgi:hypothetical protein